MGPASALCGPAPRRSGPRLGPQPIFSKARARVKPTAPLRTVDCCRCPRFLTVPRCPCHPRALTKTRPYPPPPVGYHRSQIPFLLLAIFPLLHLATAHLCSSPSSARGLLPCQPPGAARNSGSRTNRLLAPRCHYCRHPPQAIHEATPSRRRLYGMHLPDDCHLWPSSGPAHPSVSFTRVPTTRRTVNRCQRPPYHTTDVVSPPPSQRGLPPHEQPTAVTLHPPPPSMPRASPPPHAPHRPHQLPPPPLL
jgi:hypothetical protein